MTHKGAALGNMAPTSNTFYSPQHEFTQAERFGPTTLPSPGYERSPIPDQTSRGTEWTPSTPGTRIILCRNYTHRGRCTYGASCKLSASYITHVSILNSSPASTTLPK